MSEISEELGVDIGHVTITLGITDEGNAVCTTEIAKTIPNDAALEMLEMAKKHIEQLYEDKAQTE